MKDFEGKAHFPIDLERLPPHWASAWVGEVCTTIDSGFACGVHNAEGRGVPHLRPMNVDRIGRLDLSTVKYVDPAEDPRRVATGDVLFNNTNSPVLVGKTCHISTDADLAFSNHMTRLRPVTGVDPRFLALQLHYLWMSGFFLHRCVKHVNQASVASETLATTVPVAIPPSLTQGRVVEAVDSYLSRLDEAETALERVQRNLKRYRSAMLQAAVEGRLVPTEAELARAEGRDYEPAAELLKRILAERRRRWEEAELVRLTAAGKPPKDDKWRAKYGDPPRPDLERLPALPRGWCWSTLPQLGELGRGKSKHRPRNDPHLLGGPYPFIQTGDVRKANGFIATYEATYSEAGLAQSRLWPAGTLCITIAANIAETGILRFEACFPDSVVGLSNPSEPLLIRFLEFFVRTARAHLEEFAPATAQKNINLETLSEVAVPLPPCAEEGRIVSKTDELLSAAAHSERLCQETAHRIARLRQSILKWAFEGKLVDQDPNDEPASVLLQRIRAERAQADVEKPRTRRTRARKER